MVFDLIESAQKAYRKARQLFQNTPSGPSSQPTRTETIPLVPSPLPHTHQPNSSVSASEASRHIQLPNQIASSSRQAPVARAPVPTRPPCNTTRHWLAPHNGDLWQYRRMREQAQQAGNSGGIQYTTTSETLPRYSPPPPYTSP